MRRWKLEKPQLGQVQSPGRGRFLLGGKGVNISCALSRTRLLDGETSIAFSFRARPFIQRLSAACRDGVSVQLQGIYILNLKEGGGEGCVSTYLLMGREDRKTSTSRLMLLWSAESPEGDGATTKLGEPALQLRLGSVMGQTRHV